MDPNVSTLNSERLSRAKVAYTTRRVPLEHVKTLLSGDIVPNAGNLVLARVEKIDQHRRIHLANGRCADLFEGDEIVVCYGNRYAPDQFEAAVPDSLEPCHLAASGGIAARVLSRHTKMRQPTTIVPMGLLGGQDGQPHNISDWALKRAPSTRPRPFTLAVVGTAMNSGKTTVAVHCIRGLTAQGITVGAAKVTGTGAAGDVWLYKDAGAFPVLDFVDAGFASTYRLDIEQIKDILTSLIGHLAEAGVEAIVLEVADGIYEEETAGLLSSSRFRANVNGVLFAAGDAAGAVSGVSWLHQRGLKVLAVSGVLTGSPLAVREAKKVTGLPVIETKSLGSSFSIDYMTGKVTRRAIPYLYYERQHDKSPIASQGETI